MQTLNLDGVEVCIYRSNWDGRIVVDIQTADAKGNDVHDDAGIPRIRICVNECEENLNAAGNWERI